MIKKQKKLEKEESCRKTRKVCLYDTTLREGEQSPGFALSAKQKLYVAEQLKEIGVNTIEAGFPANRDHDYESVRLVAKNLRDVEIAAVARAVEKDISIALKSLDKAGTPVIFTFSPGTEARLKACGITEREARSQAKSAVKLARKHIDDVAFCVEFTPQSYVGKREFMKSLYETALEAGATRLVIADTTGRLLPRQANRLTQWIKTDIKGKYILSFHGHNDLDNAVQNSMETILAGADEIHVASLGLGERAGLTNLEALSANLCLYGEEFNIETSLNYNRIISSTKKIAKVFRFPISPISVVTGRNYFATAAGIHIDTAKHNAHGKDPFFNIFPEVYLAKPTYYSGPHSGKYRNGPKLTTPKDKGD